MAQLDGLHHCIEKVYGAERSTFVPISISGKGTFTDNSFEQCLESSALAYRRCLLSWGERKARSTLRVGESATILGLQGSTVTSTVPRFPLRGRHESTGSHLPLRVVHLSRNVNLSTSPPPTVQDHGNKLVYVALYAGRWASFFTDSCRIAVKACSTICSRLVIGIRTLGCNITLLVRDRT